MTMLVKDAIHYFDKNVYYHAIAFVNEWNKLGSAIKDLMKITYLNESMVRGVVEGEEIEINLDDIIGGKYKEDPSAYKEAALCLAVNIRRGYDLSVLFLDPLSCDDMSVIFLSLLLKHPELIREIPHDNRGVFALPLLNLLKRKPELIKEFENDGSFADCLFNLLARLPDLINEVANDENALNNVIEELILLEKSKFIK